MKLTSFCYFRRLDLLKRHFIQYRRKAIPSSQVSQWNYYCGYIFLIKIYLSPKFIPDKESKLCVDLTNLFFTETTNEMFSFLFALLSV